MFKEENFILIIPFIFLILKLLLNCIKNNDEETDNNEETDDNEETNNNEETLTEETLTEETLTEETLTEETLTEETLTEETLTEETLTEETLTEETLDDDTEETLTDDNEETLTDDDTLTEENKENELDDKELNDYTKSKIIKLKINNKKVDIELKYKKILRYIYENEINDGFRIIKNTIFKDIKTFKKEDKGYYYLENIGISVKFKNSNDTINEIINQCEINNIKLYIKIELYDGEVIKIKI